MFVVGLGSNLGSREAFLRGAARLLDGRPDVRVTARSRLYVTPPMGPPQPDFLNAAVRLATPRSPRELLSLLLDLEQQLGRVRAQRWGPRLIDLDILYWSGGAVDEPGLTVPHPGLAERPFAVAPLLDVAPELADRYAADPPPTRPWARTPADALDPLDALALSTTESIGAPTVAQRVERFDSELPRVGPAWVVLERWDDAARRGAKLL